MQQKVIQVGNSLAVTLPIEFIKNQKIKAGQVVHVETDPRLDFVHIHTNTEGKLSLTPEFKAWLDAFITKNKKALKELAHT